MAPLAQPLIFPRKLAAIRVEVPMAQVHEQARPCYCHSTPRTGTSCTRKQAPFGMCQNRAPPRSMSQGLPRTSLALPLSSCMSLGKLQGFLPRVTNSPNPSQQSTRPSCLLQLAGAQKAKSAFKVPPPPSPSFQGLLGYAGSGELHPSPSRTECSGLARRPTLWKGTTFCFLLPKRTFPKSPQTRTS